MDKKELLIYLIRNSLAEDKEMITAGSSALHKLTDEEWETLQTELAAQAVLTLPFGYIKRTDLLSDRCLFSYKRILMQSVTNTYGMMKEQEALTSLLKKYKIPVVVLKGSAAAVYYADPEQRAMGDIDLLVKPENFEQAFHLLQENGYRNAEELNIHKRHNEFEKNGMEIELHNRFATEKDVRQRNYLDQLIWGGMSQCIYREIMGIKFPMLPDWINGLVLLSHINYHMAEGPGLRHLIDWTMFVQEKLDDEMWDNCFKDAAKQIGIEKFAIALTRTCQLYLGLSDSITWCQCTDEKLCSMLLDYILGHGNFGMKDSRNRKRGDILIMLRHPGKYIHYAQEIGCRTWRAAQKHPFLENFAWIYQSFRFLLHEKSYGTDLKYISDYKRGVQKQQLFKKLEISR